MNEAPAEVPTGHGRPRAVLADTADPGVYHLIVTRDGGTEHLQALTRTDTEPDGSWDYDDVDRLHRYRGIPVSEALVDALRDALGVPEDDYREAVDEADRLRTELAQVRAEAAEEAQRRVDTELISGSDLARLQGENDRLCTEVSILRQLVEKALGYLAPVVEVRQVEANRAPF